MRRVLLAAALLPLLLSAAALAASAPIKVSPSSGRNGTTFSISFLTPKAAPARGYTVALRADGGGAKKSSCVAQLNFKTPPKPVGANVPITVTVKPIAADELCTGAWAVSVKNASGATVLSGGHFKLG